MPVLVVSKRRPRKRPTERAAAWRQTAEPATRADGRSVEPLSLLTSLLISSEKQRLLANRRSVCVCVCVFGWRVPSRGRDFQVAQNCGFTPARAKRSRCYACPSVSVAAFGRKSAEKCDLWTLPLRRLSNACTGLLSSNWQT